MIVKQPAYILVLEPSSANLAALVAPVFRGHKVATIRRPIDTLASIGGAVRKLEQENFDVKGIILANTHVLKSLIREKFKNESKETNVEDLSNAYRGAMFEKKIAGKDLPVLIFPELGSIVFRPFGTFLLKRYFRKLWDPTFPKAPEMDWVVLHENNVEEYYNIFKEALIMGGDIETTLEEVPFWVREIPEAAGIWLETNNQTKSGKGARRITAVPKITIQGYTGIFEENGTFTSKTITFRVDSLEMVDWMKKFNELPAIKIYQNGRYDTAYHMRYGAPMTNYLYDTYQMMHSWYAELPRDLGFISSFMLKNHMYWKDEADSSPLFYNAMDCHAMTWACLFMLQEMPDWAKKNYKENFPLVFPCIQCNMDGVLVDQNRMRELRDIEAAKTEAAREELAIMTDEPWFNAGSSNQVKALWKAIGFKADSTDKFSQQKFRETNELYNILGEKIEQYRKATKAVSTYFEIDLFNGRLLYSLDNAGTDSSRFACRASDFWCGTQIQNIPLYAKDMVIPEPGWDFGAIDNSQSESRCTAYISEDLNLIDAVETSKDFHTRNASLFFGIPEEDLYEMKKKDPISYKVYRNQIGKKINHGANYNMGDNVLLQNMGAKQVIAAAKALKLPSTWKLRKVCSHLLGLFDKTYPLIRDLSNPKSYYYKVVKELEETSMLVLPDGWVRYCFGKIKTKDGGIHKPTLNSYVAHKPQAQSVRLINKAYFKVWKRFQIQENKIRVKAQIHDEIMFSHRSELSQEENDYIYNGISEIMAEPITINGRVMVIPNDQARNGKNWAECK